MKIKLALDYAISDADLAPRVVKKDDGSSETVPHAFADPRRVGEFLIGNAVSAAFPDGTMPGKLDRAAWAAIQKPLVLALRDGSGTFETERAAGQWLLEKLDAWEKVPLFAVSWLDDFRNALEQSLDATSFNSTVAASAAARVRS